MGNSGSGQGEERKHIPEFRVSAKPQHKVLIDLNVAPKLRRTENGAILHNGGTISLRKQEKKMEELSEVEHFEFRRNIYGSEPDLRFTIKDENLPSDSASKLRISRTRKKYKAPPAPQGESSMNDYFDDWETNENTRPSRRLRLFKTRAELRKKPLEQSSISNFNHGMFPPSGRLQRSFSSPQFHPEAVKPHEESNIRTLVDGCFNKVSNRPYDRKDLPTDLTSFHNHSTNINREHNERLKEGGSNADDEIWMVRNKSPVPVKTFYFGMDVTEDPEDPFAIETFASRIQHASRSSSESQTSSNDGFTDIIYDEVKGGISVQLRATLPRKQIDIPRFSPAAAWRMLSNLDSLPSYQEDDVIPIENRVLAPPLPVQIPAIMDKSADSGISGDASPQQHDSAAWTPQQDLEDTSSEGGFPLSPFSDENCAEEKYTPRFILSLPKDDKSLMFPYNEKAENHQPYSLQNIRNMKKTIYNFGKSVQNSLSLNESTYLDNNWVLSCSIPSSLSIVKNKWNEETSKSNQDEDSMSLSQKPSFSYIATGGHIMYLPEYTKPRNLVDVQTFSKSCENLNQVSEEFQVSTKSEDGTKPKSKKFTFQSTLRQNERKIIADKLSKQAEYKELKRRSELEVMQKVEEEFQKKREREKAAIRQQLRLYSLNNQNVNTSESPPSSSQVLSELKEPLEGYKEYRKHRFQSCH